MIRFSARVSEWPGEYQDTILRRPYVYAVDLDGALRHILRASAIVVYRNPTSRKSRPGIVSMRLSYACIDSSQVRAKLYLLTQPGISCIRECGRPSIPPEHTIFYPISSRGGSYN